MSLTDLIKRRENIVYQESEGINLAIYLINEFQDRTFTFKGLKNKYFGLSGENLLKRIQEELDSMLILYRYTTKVKTYTDRKGVPQVKIKLVPFLKRNFHFCHSCESRNLRILELGSRLKAGITQPKSYPNLFETALVGKASTMDRYNPLDIELDIKTEMPEK